MSQLNEGYCPDSSTITNGHLSTFLLPLSETVTALLTWPLSHTSFLVTDQLVSFNTQAIKSVHPKLATQSGTRKA